MLLPSVTVVVESRLECVPLAGTVVRAFCHASGASNLESGQIELCIMEAVNNCVVHAYQSEPGHAIEVVASCHDGEFRFEVYDQGKARSPETLRRSRRHLLDFNSTSLDSLPERGRGLAIIESIMDGMEYVTLGGKNRFLMTKRIARELYK
jgi:serine/threonine-protein kinase RsbW